MLSELKKKEPALESVNTVLLNALNPDEVTVGRHRHRLVREPLGLWTGDVKVAMDF